MIWALDDEVISKICTLHVSGSYFPIAFATGATDEKRSATAQMTDFILAGLRGNSLSGGRRGPRRPSEWVFSGFQ